MEEFLKDLLKNTLHYGQLLIVAVLVLVAGLWIIKRLSKWLRTILEKKSIDPTLTPFVVSMTNVTLKVLLVVSVVSYVGIPMTSFVAILGAAGLAVGMALQGTLQNFAGGVMLLLFRPFKVGDFVEVKGYAGTVKEIQIFSTLLTTTDNKVVLIPNGSISTDTLVNYSKMPERRVDLTFGIGYECSIDEAYSALRDVISRNDKILKEPAEPFMAVSALADSSVNIAVRLWVKSADYWSVYFYMNEEVKKEFDQRGISIPYPQRSIHINQ